ncbi:MAG: hypothetical protein QHH14_10730 [Clostridiales bacterium]|nr:hypothetical protein [Clostridiales bacterium]
MDEANLLKKLDRVQAPPGFEQKVMAQLSLRKRTERERRRVFGLSLAGAFASFLAVLVLVNVFVLQKKTPLGLADNERGSYPISGVGLKPMSSQTIPVIETLDYATEIRSKSSEPGVIYLLEHVTDTAIREIKY